MNWISVKHFPLEQDLSALSRYLRERGLVHRIVEENGRQLLAVTDATVIPALQDFIVQYEQGQIELTATSAPLAAAHNPDIPSLADQIASAPIVVVLIVLSGLGALLTETVIGNPWLHYFTFQDFNTTHFIPLSDSLSRGEIWRLLTPAFLHFGLFHVLFNSLWLWDLGRRLEYLQGRGHFLIFFIVTGIVSNLAQFFWSGASNFGGMSGVVYALVGFIAVRQRIAPHPLVAVSPVLLGFMLLWLVLCITGVVDYFISGSVANAAHVGGLVIGALYALLTKNLYRHIK